MSDRSIPSTFCSSSPLSGIKYETFTPRASGAFACFLVFVVCRFKFSKWSWLHGTSGSHFSVHNIESGCLLCWQTGTIRWCLSSVRKDCKSWYPRTGFQPFLRCTCRKTFQKLKSRIGERDLAGWPGHQPCLQWLDLICSPFVFCAHLHGFRKPEQVHCHFWDTPPPIRSRGFTDLCEVPKTPHNWRQPQLWGVDHMTSGNNQRTLYMGTR